MNKTIPKKQFIKCGYLNNIRTRNSCRVNKFLFFSDELVCTRSPRNAIMDHRKVYRCRAFVASKTHKITNHVSTEVQVSSFRGQDHCFDSIRIKIVTNDGSPFWLQAMLFCNQIMTRKGQINIQQTNKQPKKNSCRT